MGRCAPSPAALLWEKGSLRRDSFCLPASGRPLPGRPSLSCSPGSRGRDIAGWTCAEPGPGQPFGPCPPQRSLPRLPPALPWPRPPRVTGSFLSLCLLQCHFPGFHTSLLPLLQTQLFITNGLTDSPARGQACSAPVPQARSRACLLGLGPRAQGEGQAGPRGGLTDWPQI